MPVSISENMSFWSLIVNASILVQLVMVALLVMSLVSWWYIFGDPLSQCAELLHVHVHVHDGDP